MPEHLQDLLNSGKISPETYNRARAAAMSEIQVPRFDQLEQYLGLWCIEPTKFAALFKMVQGMNLPAHMAAASVNTQPKVSKADGIARIEIRGVMTKQGSSLSDAGATVRVRREIRNAVADATVGGLFLVWETPGGCCAGVAELAADIAEAAKQKPVVSFIEDECCSAGYYGASQSTEIFANREGAWLGSVGTFIGLYDESGAAEMAGIKPVVIATGALKGTGFPGTVITDEQQQMLQGLANSTQQEFTAAIKRSRALTKEQFAEVLSAKVYPASEALSLGLIDGIKNEQQALAELQKLMRNRRKENKMSESASAAVQMAAPLVQTATLDELTAACPGANSDFLLGQLKAGATAARASQAYCDVLRLEAKSLNEKLATLTADHQTAMAAKDAEIADLKSQVEKLGKAKGQHGATTEKQPAQNADANAQSATERWNDAIAAKVAKGMTKQAAIGAVNKEQPGLREQMVAEANSKKSAA